MLRLWVFYVWAKTKSMRREKEYKSLLIMEFYTSDQEIWKEIGKVRTK